ncbi:PcfJ domain-containing protein [Agrobacterium salinitolerans]|nr:PcfJ domain-containing protein [Agrobacterium salinitolerans]
MRKPLRPEISSFLWKLTDDPEVLRLLELSLGRVLDNAAARGEFSTGLVSTEQAAHIRDWLAAAAANDEQWLKATDHEGRPRKLLKFGSIGAIISEADKAMRKFAQKNRSVILEEGSEELYAELEDGHYVVRLLTPEALDRESGEMRHCVGQGAYDHKVGTEHYDYFSVRDRHGKPRLTIELDLRPARGPIILQCQGKQNQPPTAEQAMMLGPMFKEKGIRAGQIGDIVYDQHWAAHHVASLPNGTVVRGDLAIRRINDLTLPEDLTVHGEFTCENCHDIVMPRRLRVGEGLMMTECSVREAAEWIAVGKDAGFLRIKTPALGVAELIKARRLHAVALRDWTRIEGIDADVIRIENCGVDTVAALMARDRTRASMIAERGRS